MGAVTPGETLGTLYNIRVGSNKTKQHVTVRMSSLSPFTPRRGRQPGPAGPIEIRGIETAPKP